MESQEKSAIIIILIAALVIPANAYIQDDINNLTKTDLSDESVECGMGSYWYKVNPIVTQSTGAIFTIFGTTNLPVGQEISYMIQVSEIGPGSPELRPPSYIGTTTVIAGNEGINFWSAEVDTTKFETDTGIQSDAIAGNYSLIIGPFCKEIFHFDLIDNSTSQNGTFKSNLNLGCANKTDSSMKIKKSAPAVFIVILCVALAIFFRINHNKK